MKCPECNKKLGKKRERLSNSGSYTYRECKNLECPVIKVVVYRNWIIRVIKDSSTIIRNIK